MLGVRMDLQLYTWDSYYKLDASCKNASSVQYALVVIGHSPPLIIIIIIIIAFRPRRRAIKFLNLLGMVSDRESDL